MTTSQRTGLIAKKMGMTRIFDDAGKHVPVTVLQVTDAQVTAQKTMEKDGYTAVQVGAFDQKPHRVSAAMTGHFAKAGTNPKMELVEFRVDAANLLPVGQAVTVEQFAEGQFVDIVGTTKGRGFAGVMRRWGFSGLRATHGVSISHRSHGSTGQRQDPGRVFKGKKMAGHWGDERMTQQNLQVVRVDAANGVLLVKGSVPGGRGKVVLVSDAVKKPAKAK
ncbi:MAG: 50S ribosomal protein L3 [Alphaproteobacteria bacterium]